MVRMPLRRRALRVVVGAVLVAKIQVIEERAVRVLDVEVALLLQESHEKRVDLGELSLGLDALVGAGDGAHGVILPVRVLGDARLDDDALERAFERVEDGAVEVELLHGLDTYGARVVASGGVGDGGFALNGELRNHGGILCHRRCSRS